LVSHVLDNSAQTSPSDTITGLQDVQVIRQKGRVPLGSLGIDFYVISVPYDKSSLNWTLALLMRDYLITEMDLTNCLRDSQCFDTSYVQQVDETTGQMITVNATGVVVEYLFQHDLKQFTADLSVMSAKGFQMNSAAQELPSGWERNDWFGVGLSAAWDYKYGRYVVSVGAPRSSLGLFTFFRGDNAIEDLAPKLDKYAGKYPLHTQIKYKYTKCRLFPFIV
jgi:hypothetical protein